MPQADWQVISRCAGGWLNVIGGYGRKMQKGMGEIA
jgi:hypothetical protein